MTRDPSPATGAADPADPADLVWSYFAHLGRGDVVAAAALLDDDGTWWTCGSRRTIPMREHKALFPRAVAMVPLRFTRRATFSAGDQVVLELESAADLADGQRYRNVYAFVVTVAGGRIRHVREYSDTAHLAAVAPAMKALYAGGGDDTPGGTP